MQRRAFTDDTDGLLRILSIWKHFVAFEAAKALVRLIRTAEYPTMLAASHDQNERTLLINIASNIVSWAVASNMLMDDGRFLFRTNSYFFYSFLSLHKTRKPGNTLLSVGSFTQKLAFYTHILVACSERTSDRKVKFTVKTNVYK